MFHFTSLTQRFAVWFAVVALLPILLIGYSLLQTFEAEIKKAVIQQVSSIADKKIEQIDAYFNERMLDASVIQAADTTHQAIKEYTAAFKQFGVNSEAYRDLDAIYRNHFERFVKHADYYDVFLISTDGWIVFTYSRESDFATSLLTDPIVIPDWAPLLDALYANKKGVFLILSIMSLLKEPLPHLLRNRSLSKVNLVVFLPFRSTVILYLRF